MDLPFASHLHGTLAGQDLVLLDLTSGHYDFLAGLGANVAMSDDHRSIRTDDAELAQSLAAMGLFSSSPSNMERPFPKPPGRTALRAAYLERTPVRDRLWLAEGWIDMLRHGYGKGFSTVVAKARTRPAPCGKVNEDRLIQLAATFDRLSVWTPFQGECFYRCQMLLQMLGPLSEDVDWIFGVRTWPFYAHCWLQAGDLVLTDQPERLAMFSPILAI